MKTSTGLALIVLATTSSSVACNHDLDRSDATTEQESVRTRSELVRTSRRTVRIQSANNRTATETLDVPANAESVTIVARGNHADSQYVFESLIGPDGRDWISKNPKGVLLSPEETANPLVGLRLSPNRSLPASGTVTTLFPNTPEQTLAPGKWRFSIWGGVAGEAEDLAVTIHLKTKAATTTWAKMLITLNFDGSHGWTAATAPGDRRFQDAWAITRNIFAAANIIIVPTYRDVPNPAKISNPLLASERAKVLEHGAPQGLNLFFVGDLFPLAGLAGALPGPALVAGTPTSGVLIGPSDDLRVPGAQAAGIGRTMAHEACHFLGLYHTKELAPQFGRTIEDPIADTKADDQENLMYPVDEALQSATLSKGQVTVIRRNPLLIPLSDAEAAALGAAAPEG
jgi:hypothetical protein